jgi:SAM-dependent methyltransferase
VNCRHCRAPLTQCCLDLGSAPPSNAYLRAEALAGPEVHLPLRLMVCTTCWLVQTQDFAGREALFTEEYGYFSSMSSSWLAHSRAYVESMRTRFQLGAASLVAEIASNDGYLLQYVRDAGIACFGIEPTASTAAAARAKGIETIEAFFGRVLAETLVADGRAVDLVAANNVLAHVPDINDFVAGFATLLKPQGVATFEFPHLLRMIEGCQFDTAYHEHYSYLSLTTVQRIFEANGLHVFDVVALPTHGGSLRVFAQRSDSGGFALNAAVACVLAEEARAGVMSLDFYTDFQRQAERIKDDFVAFLIEAKRARRRVCAYGAAAKGNTLLNFAGVRPDLIEFVVDRSPGKQGRFMPGSHIPIVAESRLQEAQPDCILLLPWNLRAELVEQLDYARRWGTKFITAVPSLEVVA